MSEEYQGADEYTPLTCELWFETVPAHDNPLLLTVLTDAFPHVEHVDDEVRLTHESLVHATPEGVPAWGQTVLTADVARVLPSTEQSWDWPEAASALATCRGILRLTERSLAWVDPARRVAAFREVLRVVVEAMGPSALVWPALELVSHPADVVDPRVGAYNVRRHRSPEAADGWVIDTLGMEGLNIPDLECHFRGLDPDDVAALLAQHADAFIGGTEFIADGDPVVVPTFGPAGDDMWFTARYALATMPPPERRVVALVPPPEHAVAAPPDETDLGDLDDLGED